MFAKIICIIIIVIFDMAATVTTNKDIEKEKDAVTKAIHSLSYFILLAIYFISCFGSIAIINY